MFVLHETYKAVTNSDDPTVALLLAIGLAIILVFLVYAVVKSRGL